MESYDELKKLAVRGIALHARRICASGGVRDAWTVEKFLRRDGRMPGPPRRDEDFGAAIREDGA
jgi:hypothetical protein